MRRQSIRKMCRTHLLSANLRASVASMGVRTQSPICPSLPSFVPVRNTKFVPAEINLPDDLQDLSNTTPCPDYVKLDIYARIMPWNILSVFFPSRWILSTERILT